ncbi:MAG: hypothetical protein ACRDUX_00785 [Mycobacterium sp.]|nr:hypothetical protein [Mycolicibacterium cosmeticum]
MSNRLFSGFEDAGWDHAPWDDEPWFSPAELAILLDPVLSVAEAADRVGCVERDVVAVRRIA